MSVPKCMGFKDFDFLGKRFGNGSPMNADEIVRFFIVRSDDCILFLAAEWNKCGNEEDVQSYFDTDVWEAGNGKSYDDIETEAIEAAFSHIEAMRDFDAGHFDDFQEWK